MLVGWYDGWCDGWHAGWYDGWYDGVQLQIQDAASVFRKAAFSALVNEHHALRGSKIVRALDVFHETIDFSVADGVVDGAPFDVVLQV